MTGRGGADGQMACPSQERVEAYRCAAVRPPVAVQVERISIDLANLTALAVRGSPLTGGAALAAAHGALMLAVTPVVEADDRRRRSQVLQETVASALADAGLGHVMELVEAALANDGDPARLGRGVETAQ